MPALNFQAVPRKGYTSADWTPTVLSEDLHKCYWTGIGGKIPESQLTVLLRKVIYEQAQQRIKCEDLITFLVSFLSTKDLTDNCFQGIA